MESDGEREGMGSGKRRGEVGREGGRVIDGGVGNNYMRKCKGGKQWKMKAEGEK